MKQKILILYTSHGLGHKMIAENIGWHLEQAGHTVKLGDLLQLQSGKLVSIVAPVHKFVNAHMGWFWKFLYTNKIFTNLTLPLRVKVASKNSEKVLGLINEFKSEVVLVTQGSFAAVVVHLKQMGLYHGQLGIAFSDYHLHRYWLYDEADFYLVNIPEQKTEMMRLGISGEKIFVIGITLKPLIKADPLAVRSKLGLLSTEHLVVLGIGGLGIGLSAKQIKSLADALLHQSRARGIKLVLAVICGKNEKLYRQLSAFNLPHVKVFAYYMPLSELYQVADAYITKPGGLSMAEALAYRLPVLLTHFLPGQEELNLHYLTSRELVMGYIPITVPEMVAHRVMEEVVKGEFRKKLAQNPLIDQLSPTDGRRLNQAFDSREVQY